MNSDSEQGQRAEARLAGEKRFLEMVATGHPTLEILDAPCHLVESTAAGCYCSMRLVVSGKLNKQVGGDLGISGITVKAHRGRVMRKMKADSLADLVNMAARLHLAPAPSLHHGSASRGMRDEGHAADQLQ